MMENKVERKVICAISKSEFETYREHRDENLGKVDVLFEVQVNGDITPINTLEMFCETEQAFVTNGFSDIKEKFGTELFEARCVKTDRYEMGKCLYITRSEHCQGIRGLQIAEVISESLPEKNNPIIIPNQQPIINNILIEQDGNIYGPFDYSIINDDNNSLLIKPVTASINFQGLDTYYIAKFSSATIEPFIKRLNGRTFVGSMKKIVNKSYDKIDFISDDAIINLYGGKIARSGVIRNFTKNTIRLISTNCSLQRDYHANKDRYDRLATAMNEASNWSEEQVTLINVIASSEQGRDVISKYVSENKEIYFQSEKINFLNQLEESTTEQKIALEQLKKEKEILEQETKKIAKENLEYANAVDSIDKTSEQEKQIKDQNIGALSKEETQLKLDIEKLQKTYGELKKLQDIEDEISYKKRSLKELEKEEGKLKESNNNTRNRLKASHEELRDRLIGMKPEVDALCGIATIKRSKNYNFRTDVLSTTPELEEFVDLAQNNLNNLGRNYDYNSVANILTTIAQTQFTLFSGLPGTGKTSLAKLLGRALGLEQRLLNIPVARGWTSSRDSLGFFNALSQSYSPAANGLFELISELDEEVNEKGQESTASIVLLDEFNLSQPEHYFSPFMEMADKESKRIITTGDYSKPVIKIPDYLRFIGTINQDESVQSLTPRMLDRAAIINFNDSDINYDIQAQTNNELTPLNISGSAFIKLFSSKNLAMPDQQEKLIVNIANALKDQSPKYGMPIILSYRKINAIRSYYNVASPLMYPNQALALDLAITQHIIPTLNGYGEAFSRRLEHLLSIIPQEMETSSMAIGRILEQGKLNMNSFGDFL